MSKFDNLGKASESYTEALLKNSDSDWANTLDRQISEICQKIKNRRASGYLRTQYEMDALLVSDQALNKEILEPLKILGYRVEYKYYIAGQGICIYISWDKKEAWPLEWSA